MDTILYNKIEEEANRIINSYLGNITSGAIVGIYTPHEDLTSLTINHPFNSIPKLAVIVGVPNVSSWGEVPTGMILNEGLGSSPANGDYNVEYSSAQKMDYMTQMGLGGYQSTSSYTTVPASMTANSVTFVTGRYYNGIFKAGYTYIYIIVK